MRTQTKGRSCTGKRPYSSKKIATGVMWSKIRRKQLLRNEVHVYKCQFGEHWHIGHLGPDQRKRR